jgi:hypothetical protein
MASDLPMKYLLLIPATSAIFSSLIFWSLLLRHELTPRQWIACAAAALSLQATALWTASYIA